MKYFLPVLLCLCLISQAQAQHTNVRVSDKDYPNEPSICLDPKNPARIVAGANLNNVYTSSDTGATWTANGLTSPYGVWGDPVIGVDTAGAFLFLHLSNPPSGKWIDRIVCQKSSDGGATWSPGTFMGLNAEKKQDKHWIAVDPATNAYYVTWTEFDNYGTAAPTDSSRILFSKSTDGGVTWSPAKRLNKVSGDCQDSDNTVEGAVPAVGPDGEIYVAWAGPLGLVFDRSADGGQTWLAEDIKIGDFPGGWDYEMPGIFRCNGLPVTACDQSHGPYRGTIYVNWTDQRNGPGDTDVWLAKSTDGGFTWSAPIRVNDDPAGKQQFFTWMTVDQATGWLWFVFYDRRGLTGDQTNVYMAVSTDGGATFKNFRVSEAPFLPNNQVFFGDYTNVTAHHNVVRPIWTSMAPDGQTSVWTALVDLAAIGVSGQTEPREAAATLLPNYPNPAGNWVYVPFKIRNHTLVTLQITDQRGDVLKTIFENRPYEYGKYVEKVDLKSLGLSPGTYYTLLRGDGNTMARKMVVLEP